MAEKRSQKDFHKFVLHCLAGRSEKSQVQSEEHTLFAVYLLEEDIDKRLVIPQMGSFILLGRGCGGIALPNHWKNPSHILAFTEPIQFPMIVAMCMSSTRVHCRVSF